ncbi:hypothetical protein ACFQJD_06080 [Haloplanus sp. GCM10025708]|uniref:DUF7549 family protein n=1 Tax=Haloferacaceae TaxID=1644056 RepID=UPI00360878C3
MVWVRSEYAGELAVLVTWLAVLVPWNATYSPDVVGGVLSVWFPFFEVRYVVGLSPVGGLTIHDLFSARALQSGTSAYVGYSVWVVGAMLLAVAVAISLLYYVDEARVEASPVDPVRALGACHLLAGVAFGAATYLVTTRGLPGYPLPIGVLLFLGFGVLLLTVERT